MAEKRFPAGPGLSVGIENWRGKIVLDVYDHVAARGTGATMTMTVAQAEFIAEALSTAVATAKEKANG